MPAKKKKSVWRRSRWLIILSLVTLGVASGFLWGRSYLLRTSLEKAKALCADKLEADLSWTKPRWTGLAALSMDTLQLQRGDQTILLVCGLETKVNAKAFVSGGQKISFLSLTSLQLVWPARTEKPTGAKPVRKLPQLPSELADLPGWMCWIPSGMRLEDMQIRLPHLPRVHIDSLTLTGTDFRCEGIAGESSKWSRGLSMQGTWDVKNGKMSMVLHCGNTYTFSTGPLVKEGDGWNYPVAFSGRFNLASRHMSSRHGFPVQVEHMDFVLSGSAGSKRWQVKTCEGRVGEVHVSFDGSFYNFEDGTLHIDGDAAASVGEAIRSLPGCYTRTPLAPEVTEEEQCSFLAETLDAEGGLNAGFRLHIPQGHWEEMDVHLEYKTHDIKLHRAPEELNRFREPFVYSPEGSSRTLRMDPAAPSYTRLEAIPALLRSSVILAEDPNFYTHDGIDTAVIRKAILDNLHDGKFSRGGSTITMQLVKNILLTREKTLARKAEEILLTLVIESDTSITKDHLLELYLNLIEWGPEVYGVKEASAFYFAKSPAQLMLDECLFLACIIPNPRKYKSLLSPDGTPTDEVLTIFDLMKLQLYDLNLIGDEELEAPVALKVK